MKKRVISIIISVLFVVCFLFGCEKKKTDEELIRGRIDTFVTVYNDGDFEGVLECFDAKTRNTLQATFNVLGGLVGGLTGFSFDLGDLFTLGIAMMDGEVLAIEVDEISIDSDSAVVSAKMGYADIGQESVEVVYIMLVKEGEDWFIQDITDIPPVTEGATDVNFHTFTNDFSHGNACVLYEKGGVTYFGVMDANGNIYGSMEGSINLWSDMGNGASYFDFGVLMIMNADHEITAVIKEYDEVVATGYGKAWIYKREDTIDGTKHLYGLINDEGEWVIPFIDLGLAPPSGVSSFVSMLSEDMLLFDDYYGYNHHYTIYNTKTKQTIWLKGATIQGAFDGVIYVKNGDWLGGISFDGKEWLDIYEYFCIYENGNYEEISPFSTITDGKMIIRGEEYVEILDLKTQKKVTYTVYEKEMVKNVFFEGEYGLITLSGKDGNSYFTLVDKNGVQQFSPIQYVQAVNYSDGVISYAVEYSGWSYGDCLMCAVNERGEVLIGENSGFCIIGAFNSGIAIAMDKKTEKIFFIDKNGNKLFTEVKIMDFNLEEISASFQ